MGRTIEEIHKENVNKYGPIQKCCNQFESVCRCYTMNWWIENMGNNFGGIPLNILDKLKKNK